MELTFGADVLVAKSCELHYSFGAVSARPKRGLSCSLRPYLHVSLAAIPFAFRCIRLASGP